MASEKITGISPKIDKAIKYKNWINILKKIYASSFVKKEYKKITISLYDSD